MGTETTFISYARADSEFALKLARDLRDAGADVWLDQLDIKSGSRWDTSIEAALKESNKMLIILSPDSVSSNNVMDEVSFALEQGKVVFPVLIKSCEIPFRLRRLQYANFSLNYDEGLKFLLQGMNLGREKDKIDANEKDSLTGQETETFINNQNITQDVDYKKINTHKDSFGKKYKLHLTIAAITIAFFGTVWIAIALNTGQTNNPKLDIPESVNIEEDKAWETALQENTILSYQNYQAQFPNGKYYSNSIQKISSLQNDSIIDQTSLTDNTAKSPKAVNNAIKKPTEKASITTQEPVVNSVIQPTQGTKEEQIDYKVDKNKIDLTGRWITDENLEWNIVQTGTKVKITFIGTKGKPDVEVEGTLTGNYLYYRKDRSGNDLEGKFTVNEDQNSMYGKELKFAGMRNNLKVIRKPKE